MIGPTESGPGAWLADIADASPQVRKVRAFDWAATALGCIGEWSVALRTAAAYVLETPVPAALVWGPALVTIYNDAFLPILGAKREALGRSFADVWHEVWADVGPIATAALAGRPTYLHDFPLTVDRTGKGERAYFTFAYTPVRGDDGAIAGFIDTVVETTEAVQARAQVDLLNRELSHRLKNTMAMVQAIAAQTLKGVEPREAVVAFQARVLTLSRAHDVLLRGNTSVAPIVEVLESITSLFAAPERFVLTGTDIPLGPKAALSLALLAHELATNAMKYGSLSCAGGAVAIDWRVEGEELVIAWHERGGPPAVPPEGEGFGSRLINLGLQGTGLVDRRYSSHGFEVEFRSSLSELLDR